MPATRGLLGGPLTVGAGRTAFAPRARCRSTPRSAFPACRRAAPDRPRCSPARTRAAILGRHVPAFPGPHAAPPHRRADRCFKRAGENGRRGDLRQSIHARLPRGGRARRAPRVGDHLAALAGGPSVLRRPRRSCGGARRSPGTSRAITSPSARASRWRRSPPRKPGGISPRLAAQVDLTALGDLPHRSRRPRPLGAARRRCARPPRRLARRAASPSPRRPDHSADQRPRQPRGRRLAAATPRNPVPLLAVGPQAERFADLRSILEVTPAILAALGVEEPSI